MPKLPSRIGLIGAAFVVAAAAVVGRAAQLQLFQGGRWTSRSGEQHTALVNLPARRGALLDRNGVALAVSQETFTIGVAPRELDDPARAARVLSGVTGRPRADIAASLRSGRVWLEWPGPYTWEQVEPLRSLRGVHLSRRLERFYPRPGLASRLVGRVDQRGRGGSGLERAFDSLLSGRAGTALMLRDNRGTLYPSPSRPAAAPVDGADVMLTIDAELQDIAERSLAQAVREAGASGGDVVILQPTTGEILAIASHRTRGSGGGAVGVIGDPYEPGSTAKIFTAAALLRLNRATPLDTVFTENGVWTVEGRTIHDTHKAGTLTLADVIRFSSNIGIAKLGTRLRPAEHYEALRDFGFGSPTGIEFPGESPGRLRAPRHWTVPSAASHAMGYEFAVTPLQLAAAYATFATGGILLEPSLVREVHHDGDVRWAHAPRPVRRVVSEQVSDQLAHMLLGVVEDGTGSRAALGTYAVAGKTGTARRTVDGRYESGRYYASFVGLFPAVDPQLVLLVKIDDPEGDYFGGSTAAPVVRTILEAALATPSVTLDRSRLSRRRVPAAVRTGEAADRRTGEAAENAAAVVVDWPMDTPSSTPQALESPRPVPDVAGQSFRDAVRTLHRSGFRVRIEGSGAVTSTVPAAGEPLAPGRAVRVIGERARAL